MSGDNQPPDGRSIDLDELERVGADVMDELAEHGITSAVALTAWDTTTLATLVDSVDRATAEAVIEEANEEVFEDGVELDARLEGRTDADLDPKQVAIVTGENFASDSTTTEIGMGGKIHTVGKALDAVGWSPDVVGLLGNGSGSMEFGGTVVREWVNKQARRGELIATRVFDAKWDDTEGKPAAEIGTNQYGDEYWTEAAKHRNEVLAMWADAVLVISPDGLTGWLEGVMREEAVPIERYTVAQVEEDFDDDGDGFGGDPVYRDRDIAEWDPRHRDFTWDDPASPYYMGPGETERSQDDDPYAGEGNGDPTAGKKEFTTSGRVPE